MNKVEIRAPYELRNFKSWWKKEYVLKDLGEEERQLLQRIASAFFSGLDTVLAVPSGDPNADQLQIMTELYHYLEASHQKNVQSFASEQTTVGKGHIECLYWIYEHNGTCYDGGCYSDDSYTEHYALHIDIISQEKWDSLLGGSHFQREPEHYRSWTYNGSLPHDDALAFPLDDPDTLYLYHPFGSVLNFRLSWLTK